MGNSGIGLYELGAVSALLMAMVGCSERSEPIRQAAVSAPLHEAKVSAPFDLEPYPDGIAIQPSDEIIACGSSKCLYVYQTSIDGNLAVYGLRTTPTGTPLDSPHRHLRGVVVRAVVPVGPDFLVAALDYDSTHVGYEAHVFRVDGGTGELGGDLPWSFGEPVRAVSAGNTVLVTNRLSQGVVLDAATLAAVGPTFDIPFNVEAMVPGPDQYLLTDGTQLMLVDATTGGPLDASPATFNGYRLPYSVDGVYEGGVYTLAWTSGHDVYLSRVKPDGSLLDPDDDFNQISGAISLCTGCSQSPLAGAGNGGVSVASIGGQVTVFWTTYPAFGWQLRASRFDPATGMAVSGDTTAPELALSYSYRDPVMSVGDAGGVVLYKGQADALEVTTDPFSITQVSGEQLPYRSASRSYPSVAYDGQTFLVAWAQEGVVRASRIDPSSGTYLDDPPLAIGSGSHPAVTSDGTDFLVAWVVNDYQVTRRVVHGDGSMEAEVAPAFDAGSTSSALDDVLDVRLVGNGKYYLLSWVDQTNLYYPNVEGVRLRSDGTAVDGSVVQLAVPHGSAFHATVADRPSDPTKSTFLVIYNSTQTGVDLTITRYRSELGSLIDPVTTIDSGNGEVSRIPFAATDGTHLIAGWTESSTSWLGAIDPLSGELVGAARGLGGIDRGWMTGLWYDGLSFDVAFWKAVPTGIQVRLKRFDTDLSPLDTAYDPTGQILLDDLAYKPSRETFAVAAGPVGRSLLVYQDVSRERHGVRLAGRFLDNDGQPTVGAALDAGAGNDGDSGTLDGGSPILDGGSESDAASLDADAGLGSRDGASSPDSDAGAAGGGSSSGGCATAGPLGGSWFPSWALLLASLVALRARRRRRS